MQKWYKTVDIYANMVYYITIDNKQTPVTEVKDMLRDARYEIVAQNGQVLEHSIKSHKEAVRIAWSYKMQHEDDCFEIRDYIGQYTGREGGFECSVCGKGCKAHTFNVWYDKEAYETWGFGQDHMPKIIEDLGEQEETIIGE